jgi:hypothetical protein
MCCIVDFAAFIGPPPQIGKPGNILQLYKNLAGMAVVLVMLLVATLACCCGIHDYRQVNKTVTELADPRREEFESKASYFARQRSLLDDPSVPWSYKVGGRLQTGWLAAAAICPVRGDPWRRPQRAFTVLMHVLLTMTLSIMFYQSDLPECPDTCDTNVMNSSTECACKTVDCECLPNRLQASLLTAALVLPVIALLNLSFAVLRRPLVHDMASKTGQLLLHLQKQRLLEENQRSNEREDGDAVTPSVDAKPGLCAQFGNCLQVQRQCLLHAFCHRRHRVRVSTFHPSPGAISAMPPRRRAKAGSRRQRSTDSIVAVVGAVDSTFDRHDQASNGWLDVEAMQGFLTDLNGGTPVSRSEVEHVFAQSRGAYQGIGMDADAHKRRVSLAMRRDRHDYEDEHSTRVYNTERLKTAVYEWRLDHTCRSAIAEHELCRKHTLGLDQLRQLLTDLNDGIPVLQTELQWVLNQWTKLIEAAIKEPPSAPAEGDETDANQVNLSEEIVQAVRKWYPTLGPRRLVEELKQLHPAPACVTRRAVAAQLDMCAHEVDALVAAHRKQHQRRRRPGSGDDGKSSALVSRAKLRQLMTQLLQGRRIQAPKDIAAAVSPDAVLHVIRMSDAVPTAELFDLDHLRDALAVWKCLYDIEESIDDSFDRYDTNGDGSLQRDEVQHLLKVLNEGLPVTSSEVDWTIQSGDVDGSGSLSRQELHAAISWWYLHVPRTPLDGISPVKAALPWALSGAVAIVCTLVVASYSADFSGEKTVAWLWTTVLGLALKMLLLDPFKALCCGSLIDPIYSVICCDLSAESMLESLEETVEVYTENFTGMHSAAHGSQEQSEATREELQRQSSMGAMGLGGLGALGAGKLVHKARRKRARGMLSRLAEDDATVRSRLQMQRVNSDKHYAHKIEAKRLRKGKMCGLVLWRVGPNALLAMQSKVYCCACWPSAHVSPNSRSAGGARSRNHGNFSKNAARRLQDVHLSTTESAPPPNTTTDSFETGNVGDVKTKIRVSTWLFASGMD